jgi:hypothetical protein
MSPIFGPDLGPQSQLFAFQRDIVDAIGAVTSILPRIILMSKPRGPKGDGQTRGNAAGIVQHCDVCALRYAEAVRLSCFWSRGLRQPAWSGALILKGKRRGSESLMTTLQAVFLGMMISWTPSVLLMAYLLWPFEPD